MGMKRAVKQDRSEREAKVVRKRRKPIKFNRKTEAKILKDYKNPEKPGSLGGVGRFAKINNLNLTKTKRALENELAYTLHKPRRRRFATTPVMVYGMDEQWVADLIDVQKIKKQNSGYGYILTVVDVLSKYAWVEPVKTKSGENVTAAFENVMRRAKGRKPINLQTDDGKEFYNETFAAFLKKHDIHHFSTQGDTKASVVERFNRTLKDRMYRYFTVSNSLRYVQILQSLVRGYNESAHRSIGIAPAKVNIRNQTDVWNVLYGEQVNGKQLRSELKVGDKVRINKKFRTFKKSYLPGWTEEVFIVAKVNRKPPVVTYKIKEYDNTPLKGTFYKQDLQKVNVSKGEMFRIEKIVKRKGSKVLVRWKGWPVKYDSWLDKKLLRSLK